MLLQLRDRKMLHPSWAQYDGNGKMMMGRHIRSIYKMCSIFPRHPLTFSAPQDLQINLTMTRVRESIPKDLRLVFIGRMIDFIAPLLTQRPTFKNFESTKDFQLQDCSPKRLALKSTWQRNCVIVMHPI